MLAPLLVAPLLVGQTNVYADIELTTSHSGGVVAQPPVVTNVEDEVAGIPVDLQGTAAYDGELLPLARLRIQQRDQRFRASYGPLIFYRETQDAVDQVLVDHRFELQHIWRFLPQSQWTTTAAVRFGEINGIRLQQDPADLETPDQVTPNAQVFRRLDLLGGTEVESVITPRIPWALNATVLYNRPEENLLEDFQEFIQVTGGGTIGYLVTRRTRTFVRVAIDAVEFLTTPPTGQATSVQVGTAAAGVEADLSRRWQARVEGGGSAVARSDDVEQTAVLGPDFFPSALVRVDYTEEPTTRVQYSFGAAASLEGQVDQAAGDVRPRGGINLISRVVFDQKWTLRSTGSFSTTVFDGPRPTAVDEQGRAAQYSPFITILSASLAVDRNFGPHWTVSLGVDGQLSGPHLDIGSATFFDDVTGEDVALDGFAFRLGGVTGSLNLRYFWSTQESTRQRRRQN
jgi:hypothetical protein